MKEQSKRLGVAELACYGIGNCIGSGIFVSMGTGIAYTGCSIPLALIAACVVVLFAYAYKTLMAGMFVLPGGMYSQSALLQPPILVGFTALATLFSGLTYAMYAVSIVEYATVVFPGIADYRQIVAAVIITLFFLSTLLGSNFMGKLNSLMVVVLLLSLLTYVVAGIPQVNWASMCPTNMDYFCGGCTGFIMAVACMSFACQGATLPIAMTAESENPKRNLPIAILVASAVVAVIYSLIGTVSVGVLPVDEVAGKNLGVVAEEIFPHSIFVIFILGGACLAIATSLYSAIASVRYPLLATIEDGWLPAWLGARTRNGYPWLMMLLLYAVAIIPIYIDLGLQELISFMVIPTMALNLINNILMIPLVRKYPKAWQNGFFRMPMWAFYLTIILAILSDFVIVAALLTSLSAGDQYFILITVALLFVYSGWRLHRGKVNLNDLVRVRAEAEQAASSSAE